MQKKSKFVIQKHSRRGQAVHWDLMLEKNQALETYRLALSPEELAHNRGGAVRIAEHKLKFLSYEGPVNKEEGRVELADSGQYHLESQDAGRAKLYFEGKILKGTFILSCAEENHYELRAED